MSEPSPHCAVHPDAVSVGTCSRCGSFACEACWSEATRRCASCPAEDPNALPWDTRIALFSTLHRLWLSPTRAFASLGPGSLVRAWTFAWLLWMISLGIVYTVGLGSGNVTAPDVFTLVLGLAAGTPIVAAIVTAVVAMTSSLALHVPARILGGTATVRESSRAVAYLHAYVPLWALEVASHDLLAREAATPSMVLQLALGGLIFVHGGTFVRARHELSGWRASVPVVVLIVVGLFLRTTARQWMHQRYGADAP